MQLHTGSHRLFENAQLENAPESETRMENLNELINAAAEAGRARRDNRDFLDHAALVSDADCVDEHAPRLR